MIQQYFGGPARAKALGMPGAVVGVAVSYWAHVRWLPDRCPRRRPRLAGHFPHHRPRRGCCPGVGSPVAAATKTSARPGGHGPRGGSSCSVWGSSPCCSRSWNPGSSRSCGCPCCGCSSVAPLDPVGGTLQNPRPRAHGGSGPVPGRRFQLRHRADHRVLPGRGALRLGRRVIGRHRLRCHGIAEDHRRDLRRGALRTGTSPGCISRSSWWAWTRVL